MPRKRPEKPVPSGIGVVTILLMCTAIAFLDAHIDMVQTQTASYPRLSQSCRNPPRKKPPTMTLTCKDCLLTPAPKRGVFTAVTLDAGDAVCWMHLSRRHESPVVLRPVPGTLDDTSPTPGGPGDQH